MLAALRHRVTLMRPVRTYEDGSWTTSYPEEGQEEVYAAVQPLSGAEVARYAQLESGATTRVIIRPQEDFVDGEDVKRRDWRVLVGGVEHEIESVVDPDLRGRMLTLMTHESS
jgi:SPP1 family predicted phage head-tail adaptor